MPSPKPQSIPQRRPKAEDMPALFEKVAEGKSLRAACREMGLHTPMTHTFIEDEGFGEHYARAKEQRAEVLAEQALTLAVAAATGQTFEGRKVDSAGARVALDAIKWASARMSPKTAVIERREHVHQFGGLSDEELAAKIAAAEAGAASEE